MTKPITKEDICFLLSFVPDWAKEVPKGLGPTMYSTCTYRGDLEVKEHVDRIRRKVEINGNHSNR